MMSQESKSSQIGEEGVGRSVTVHRQTARRNIQKISRSALKKLCNKSNVGRLSISMFVLVTNFLACFCSAPGNAYLAI